MNQPPFALGQTPVIETPAINISSSSEAKPEEKGMWFGVDLPSMGLAGYPAQIQVRKFGAPDLARFSAARRAGSYPMVVNAMGHTISGVDVRMLTHGDFDYLIYWHATNSIKKSPLIVNWRSRYGFENKVTVNSTMRQVSFVENLDKIKELKAKGYDFSRVADELWRLHITDLGKWDDEVDFKYSLATWAKVEDPLDTSSKLAAIEAMTDDLDFYEGIVEWREAAYHGVSEKAKLTCALFTPENAMDSIIRSLAMIDASVSTGEFDQETQALTMSLLNELAVLRKLDNEGRLHEATPVEEEITIPLDVTNFFPVTIRP